MLKGFKDFIMRGNVVDLAVEIREDPGHLDAEVRPFDPRSPRKRLTAFK